MKKTILSLLICGLSITAALAQPKYEFRAAWIATVDNIDWPDRGTTNSDSQKVQFIRMLDMHQRNGLNAMIVQIRPCTDAFYPSQYEPWSEWLTGKQGRPPSPYYDPLQFMIEETHKRGMEFHAWCNPYRAEFAIGKSSISPTHITKLHPDWFLSYGGTRYFDPGNKEAQQYVLRVIRDIVSRYDIDAIHFDDYFYPYRIPGKEFPDDNSYAKYGNGMTKEDWRRSNVDSIISMISVAIKQEKKYCRFGISPFGVWRNQDKDSTGSATHAGQTNYDDLYADILLWLKKGWIDYVAPQLYWEFGLPAAPYEVLVDWWSKHTYGKQCYIGLGLYKAGINAVWKDKTLMPRELQSLRQYPEIQGAIYFSAKSFVKNPNGFCDSLQNNYYKYPALIPPMAWIDSTKPAKPVVVRVASGTFANAFLYDIKQHEETRPVKYFVIYRFNDTDSAVTKDNAANIYKIVPAKSYSASITIPDFDLRNKIFAITCVDTNNNESDLTFVK